MFLSSSRGYEILSERSFTRDEKKLGKAEWKYSRNFESTKTGTNISFAVYNESMESTTRNINQHGYANDTPVSEAGQKLFDKPCSREIFRLDGDCGVRFSAEYKGR